MQRTPSLREVAREAGVSAMAVSLALRDHPSIAETTRLRVRKVAARLGYRRNPLAAAFMAQLRRGRVPKDVRTIAYLTPWKLPDDRLNHPFAWESFQAAATHGAQLGYDIQPVWLQEPGISIRRLSDILYHRGITGVIVDSLPMLKIRRHLSLDWPRFAGVLIGDTIARPLLHRTAKDEFSNMLTALRALAHRGYRRVGLVLPEPTHRRVGFRLAAAYLVFHKYLRRSGHPPPFIHDSIEGARLLQWYRRHQPDAIVTTATYLIEKLSELGLRVPRDVAVANLDLLAEHQGVAGIDPGCRLIAMTAVDILDLQLIQNERGIPSQARVVLIPGKWCDGATAPSKPVYGAEPPRLSA